MYLMLMIAEYPVDVLEKYGNCIENYLNTALSDATADARMYARKGFLLWEIKEPDSAKNIYMMLDYSVQKAIMEERDYFDAQAYVYGMEDYDST